MNWPELVKVKVRDLKPYHHAIWSSIAGGRPFSNTIVIVQWQGDGRHVKLMLDTHNFIAGLNPDEEIEVVKLGDVTGYYAEKYGSWTLPPPPAPEVTIDSLKADVAKWKATAEMHEGVRVETLKANERLRETIRKREQEAIESMAEADELRARVAELEREVAELTGAVNR